MLPINVDSLLSRLEKSGARRVTRAVPMDANVKRLVGLTKSIGAKGVSDAPLKRLLQQDAVAWDAKARKLISTESHLKIDETVRPLDQSAIWPTSIEQCMEFVERYCRTVRAKFGLKDGGFGSDWTKQYNMVGDVQAIADGKLKKAGYTAFRNGSAVPPRAGDVLSMQSPVTGTEAPAHFHVALISDVFKRGRQWFAKVYEANVPFHVNLPDVKQHYEEIPMQVKNGKFTLGRVMTSQKGYSTDMDVAGWLHPLESKALPGAMPV